MNVAILHGEVSPDAGQDEQDTLVQLDSISRALAELGFTPVAVPLSLNIKQVASELRKLNPKFVFNLVESVEGQGQWIHLAPTLLNFLNLPYTGAGKDAIYLTSNKLLAKNFLKAAGVPTPPWTTRQNVLSEPISFEPPYIVKSVWEHASIGMDESSVFHDKDQVNPLLESRIEKLGGEWFVEQYIPGREFNLSILASKDGPQVLPPAEIRFVDFPDDKPKLVDYRAKWDEASFEYQNTVRSFEFSPADGALLSNLKAIAIQCWQLFNLRGYARVDFRVDERNRPWVLEVNINPCISPDSGFVAAAARAGFGYADIIQRIVTDSFDP
jgi:D-alanine-D-alanine ligase